MHDHDHSEIITGICEQFEGIFQNSKQGVYIYLDDKNKACNERFASLLGYDSAEEWGQVSEPFPSAFVAEKSQQTLISAFRDAMEKNTASKINVTWKKKSGKTVDTDVILVPIVFFGHLMALHFISESK